MNIWLGKENACQVEEENGTGNDLSKTKQKHSCDSSRYWEVILTIKPIPTLFSTILCALFITYLNTATFSNLSTASLLGQLALILAFSLAGAHPYIMCTFANSREKRTMIQYCTNTLRHTSEPIVLVQLKYNGLNPNFSGDKT